MEFARVAPESLGIPSQAILDLLDELYRYGIEMHGIMVLRHGKVCAQGWWKPYEPKTPHIMFSFSKSLTSTAIGFAWQEGILSLDERLIDIFPDKAPEHPSENLNKACIRHLLMMGCGHETEINDLGRGDPDWIYTFLHHPFVYEPGTHFLYNTAGTNLLSAILTKKTARPSPSSSGPGSSSPWVCRTSAASPCPTAPRPGATATPSPWRTWPGLCSSWPTRASGRAASS